MRLPRAIQVLTLIAFVLAPVQHAASAPPREGTLILRGSHTGYVDITFNQPVEFGEYEAAFSYKGEYVGWFIHRLGEKLQSGKSNQAGSFTIRDLVPAGDSPREPLLDFGFKAGRLDPGRYRLYLLTAGPATIRIPVEGSHGATLRPKARTTSMASVADIAVGAGGFVDGDARQAASIDRSTLAVSILVLHSERGLTVEKVEACITERERACDGRNEFAGYTFSAFSDYSFGLTAYYDPGTLARGRYDAVQEATAAGSVRKVSGALLTLNIVD